MKKNFILIFVSIFLIFSGCAKQVYKGENDILYLRSGEEVFGTVLKYEGENIIVKKGKLVKKIPKDSVSSIELSQIREGDTWKNVKDIKDEALLNAIKTNVSKFKNAGYVNIFVSKKIVFNQDSTYTITLRKIRKVMEERGKYAANNIIFYLYPDESAHLDFARAVKTDSTLVHIMDNAIENASVHPSYPDYDRLRSMKFAIPEANIGNILDYQITIKGKSTRENPFLLDDVLGDKEPTVYQKIELISPKDIKFYYGEAKPDTIWAKKDRKYAEWILKDDKGIIQEVQMPPVYDIRKRAFASPIWRIKDLINLYNIRFQNYKSIADSILGSKKDTIGVLYNFVRENIKYIPISPQECSFRPYLPTRIMKRGYGNSLDKVFLFYALLRAENIPAKAILARTKEKGKPFLEYPIFGQFDGMLITTRGKWYQPTLNIREPGVISGKYQGTMGMTISGEKIQIPYSDSIHSGTYLKRKIIILKNGDALVKEHIQFKGLDGEGIRRWKELLPEQIKINVESYINSIHSDAVLKDYHLSNLNDIDVIPELFIDYKIKRFSPPYGRFIIFHLPGLKYNTDVVSSKKRTYPIFYTTREYDKRNIELIIPRGYKIRYLIKNMKFKDDHFSLRVRKKGRRIIFNIKNIRKKTLIPQKGYRKYKKDLEKMASISEKWIVLEKK